MKPLGTVRSWALTRAIFGAILATSFLCGNLAAQQPDLTVTNVQAPSSAKAGASFTIHWTMSNIGSAATPSGVFFYDYIYLSRDSIVNPDADITIGLQYHLSPLQAGNSERDSAIVFIPDDAIGTYYITIVTDALTQVAELNESNNTGHSSKISVGNTQPDLRVLQVQAPLSGSGGHSINVTYSVINQGTDVLPRSTIYDSIVLSTDTLYDNNDQTIAFNVVDTSLAIGASYTSTVEASIPASTSGTFYVLVKTNYIGFVTELNQDNNVNHSQPIAIDLKRPDLTITQLNAPAQLITGQRIRFNYTVLNSGDASTGNQPWSDLILLSKDSIRDNADTFLAYHNHAENLNAGGSTVVSDSVALPFELPGGTYRLLVVLDALNQLNESTKNNNVRASLPINYLITGPDLIVQNVTAPGTIASGTDFTLRYTITNAGNQATNPVERTDGFYLSPDTVSMYSGRFLGSTTDANSIGAGQSTQRTATVHIPLEVTGTQYIIVNTDMFSTVKEYNESNNSGVSNQIQLTPGPGPDLQVTSVVTPASVFSGVRFNVSWDVTNTGTASTGGGGWYDVVTITSDTANTGIFVGAFITNAVLGPGQHYTNSAQVTLPGGASGTWRVRVVANQTRQLPELNSGNNQRYSSPLQIDGCNGADLITTQITFPPTVRTGQAIEVTWRVKNNGNQATSVPKWLDRIRLSVDTVLSATFMLGAFENLTYLGPGESYQRTATVTVPPELNGKYYVVVDADYQNNQLECVKSNNQLLAVIQIDLAPPPDLQVSAILTPANAFSDQVFTISYTVKNSGPGPAYGSWYDYVYLSTDTVRGQGETFMEHFHFAGSVLPESTYTGRVSVHLPQAISGRYYLLVTTNADKKLFEYTFGGNNTSHSNPITVTLAPPPDLVVSQISLPSSGSSGKNIALQRRVSNKGPGITGKSSWYDAVYFSPLASFDSASARLAGTFRHSGALLPDSSYVAADSVTIPNGISGPTYVYVRTDDRNDVFEYTFEGNNLSRSTSTINVLLSPWPDLTVKQISVPSTATAGEQLMYSFVVTNRSTNTSAVGQWSDWIYLSASETPDLSNATLVRESRHFGSLAPGASYTSNESIRIPENLSGTLYMYVFTDGENKVYEHTDENNNVGKSSAILVRSYPVADLSVDSIATPATAVVGQPMALYYSVLNSGSGRTLTSTWVDGIYLSSDTVINPTTNVLVGQIQRQESLKAGERYSRVLNVPVPTVAPGSYYLLIKTDINTSVNDGNPTNNTRHSTSRLSVRVLPPPDLAPVSVVFPPSVRAGQPMNIVSTVKNLGAGGTFQSSWYDAVYLSADQSIDRYDLLLGTHHRTDSLSSGQSYTDTIGVTIPPYLAGDYYLIFKTDSRDEIVEGDLEINNATALPISIVRALPSDLIATDVTMPASAIPGEEVTVSWVTRDLGPNSVQGRMTDAIYISSDNVWDVSDPLVGVVQRDIDLAVGGSTVSQLTVKLNRVFLADSTGTITDVLPGVSPGNYYVIVRTDIRNNMPETDETNNITSSSTRMNVDLPNLVLGIPSAGTLLRTQRKYYRVDVGAGLDLRLRLTADAASASNELYVAYGRTPTSSDFDFTGAEAFQANHDLMIPSTRSGSYYILILVRSIAAADSEHYSIRADATPFSLASIDPPEGGKGGKVTCLISGAGFRDSTQFSIENQSAVRVNGTIVQRLSTTQAYVQFDLSNAPYGRYSVKAANGGSVQSLPNVFTVAVPANNRLQQAIYAPYNSRGLLIGRPATYDIVVTNGNNNDLDLVLLTLLVPADQNFSMSTNDFFARPAPIGYPDTMSLPNAGVRINQDWAVMTVLAKNVRAGQVMKARMNMRQVIPSCIFPCGDQLPVILDVRGLSFNEFLAFEIDFMGQVRDEILKLPFAMNPAVVAMMQNPNWQLDLEQGYRDVGLLDNRQIITRTLPLVYEPQTNQASLYSSVMALAAGGRSICSMTLNAAQGLFSLFGIVNATAALVAGTPATFALIITAGGPLGWALLAVSVGILAYGMYQVHQGGDLIAAKLLCKYLIFSLDPNDIIGPPGYGDRKWIGITQTQAYTIRFENDAKLASAPAQTVTITEKLDSTADARSFRLGKFGFANMTFDVPANRSFFATRLDVRDSLGIYVDVNAGLDVTKNEAFWIFRSIDPATQQVPIDPAKGLLPINDLFNRGEGFVSYTIQPSVRAHTGDSLHAAASIVFDINPAISTPTIANAIDAGVPHSSVSVLPSATGTAAFAVRWKASDDSTGSGLASVSVFVSVNDSTFKPWLTDVTDTAAVFTGVAGNKYAFLSLAKDNAGNIEAPKASAEATTTITAIHATETTVPKQFQLYQNYPNPFNPSTTIAYDLPTASRVSLMIYNILGQEVRVLLNEFEPAGRKSVTFDAHQLSSGVYIYRLIATDQAAPTRLFMDVRKMLLIK